MHSQLALCNSESKLLSMIECWSNEPLSKMTKIKQIKDYINHHKLYEFFQWIMLYLMDRVKIHYNLVLKNSIVNCQMCQSSLQSKTKLTNDILCFQCQKMEVSFLRKVMLCYVY